MNTIIIIIFIIIIIIVLKSAKNVNEGYNMGTIIQLNAKGPQDIYLSENVNAWNHMYYPLWYNNRYRYFGPTRIKKSHRPIYIGMY